MIDGKDILFGVIILLFGSGLVYLIHRSIMEKLDQGDKIVIYFMTQVHLLLFLVTIVLTAGAAFMSASFHPPGERNDIPIPVRIMLHFAIEFVGWLMTIQAGPKVMDFIMHIVNRKTIVSSGFSAPASTTTIKSKELNRKWAMDLVFLFVGLIFTIALGFGLPILNLFIVALGMEMHTQFVWFLQDIFMDLSSFYVQVPVSAIITDVSPSVNGGFLPPDYNPLLELGYVMHMMIMVTVLNEGIAIYKSFTLGKIYMTLKLSNETPNTSNNQNTAADQKNFKELLRNVLENVFEITDANKLKGLTNKAVEAFNNSSMNTAARTQITTTLSVAKEKYNSEILQADGSLDNTKLETLKKDTARLLNKAPSSGGLGLNLSIRP